MNKFTLATIIIILGTFFMIARCEAGSFTVDERSVLHVGASALINASCNGFGTVVSGAASTGQRSFCAGLTFGVGLVKEFIVDGHEDYGDIAMNSIGIVLSDRFFAHLFPVNEGGGVGISGRW